MFSNESSAQCSFLSRFRGSCFTRLWRFDLMEIWVCFLSCITTRLKKKKIHHFGIVLRMCLRTTQGGSSKHDWSPSPTDISAGGYHRPILAYRRISLLVSNISWYGSFWFLQKKKKKCEESFIILDCISIKWSLSPLLDNHIRGNAQKKKSQNIGSCISPKDLVSSGTNWQFKDSTFLKVRLSYLFLLQSRSRRYINTMIAPKYSVHRVLHPARIQKLCL